MFVVNDRLQIPLTEFTWTYVRSGGPGGQNVNKVASKAVLRWPLDSSPSLPAEVKYRMRTLQRRRITAEGDFVMSSQRYRDQERNREDCLNKLRELILAAATVPRTRRPSKPTRGSKERRLNDKRHRSATRSARGTVSGE